MPGRERLRAGRQALHRRLRDLSAENDRLRRQLEEATRAGKRQAAPFAKGQTAAQPKKPGPGITRGRRPPARRRTATPTRRT